MEYSKKWIKEGMAVAHKELIDGLPPKKMFVEDILIKKKVYESDEIDDNGQPVKRIAKRIMGVRCHWLENNKWMHKKFHTKELVPFEIAEKGKDAIIEFIELYH